MARDSYTGRFLLEDKVAIVTGGAGILGKHFCRGLAEAGAPVAVADIDARGAASLAQEIATQYGVPTIGVECDVSKPESVRSMVYTVVKELGRIDILHNNAASKSSDLREFFAPFEQYSLSQWREVMSVNIDGMFLVAQAVGTQMIKQGEGGSIIQTSSIYGIMAPDQRIYQGSEYMGMAINTPAVYSASKAAVVGLTKYLAAYWAAHGIRVNTLTPGGNESGQNGQFQDNYSARVPLGRMGRPDEMVGALLYLASEASSYVTGHNLVVDGGLHSW